MQRKPIQGIVLRVSRLVVDEDKDWEFKAIVNIKALAKDARPGNLFVVDERMRLVPVPSGDVGYVLTSGGPGKRPWWAPPGTALKEYFPVAVSGYVEAVTRAGPAVTQPLRASAGTQWDAATMPTASYQVQATASTRSVAVGVSASRTASIGAQLTTSVV